MPKGRPTEGKWVKHKIHILDKRNCYIYKRPRSSVWQYYLQVDGEGQLRRSTNVEGDIDDINVGQAEAKEFAQQKLLESMAKTMGGMRAIVTKGLFDLMDEFLEEERKRIKPYNQRGFIVEETWRVKAHHLNLLRKFYKMVNQPIDKLNYDKLYDYPYWRSITTCNKLNPIAVKPPKTQHAICGELTTIRSYFAYLVRKKYILKVPEFRKIVRESKKDNRRDYLTIREYNQTRNTIGAWARSKTATPSQQYNRQVLYNSILIMTNSLLRVGTLRNLVWSDLDVAENIPKDEQKRHHLIRVRKEACKVGTKRTVLSPTVEYFDRIRKLAGIPKKPKSKFPHIPDEYLNYPILSKWNHPDLRLGDGTFYRGWLDIKAKCKSRYWGQKNITWYSFRHSGISFAVERGVQLITLANLAGTGLKELELVYYHHEEESRKTWEAINQNRVFFDRLKNENKDLIDYDNLLDGVETA
tara:strand:- start:2528 stop:3934 length:1407 start_codon:yes stop_codon:yes gene_type:complete